MSGLPSKSKVGGARRAAQVFLAGLTVMICVAGTAQAQVTSGPPSTSIVLPRVFLDCQDDDLPCDQDHFRTEIRFVNWARNREDADVHVIVTGESVGGGGMQFTLDFLGRAGMSGLSDRLTYTTRGSDVAAETRDGMTQTLRLGLLRYAIESGLSPAFDIRFTELNQVSDTDPDRRPAGSTALHDPWNFWTFRVELSGDADLRETATTVELNPSFSAERITQDWKFGFEVDLSTERNRRQLSGGREVRDNRDEWEIEMFSVRSVSNHVSVGVAFDGERSISENQDARVALAPAVEFNFFPYSMANRRQLTVLYANGVQYSNYGEETILGVFTEVRPQHELRIRYNAQEPWGNAGVGIEYSQYLNDVQFYRAELSGNLSFRITRGLDLNLSGSSSWVRDEIYTPLSEISDEDILLGRQSLPSGYQYTARVGLGYRWGSAFSNIVNTRFSGW